MIRGKRGLYAVVALAMATAFLKDSSASNGIKPPAVGGRSFGRAGAGIAYADDATSMHVNPALIAQVFDENISVSPILFRVKATYSDATNSSRSGGGDFPFVNSGYVFDFAETRAETREDSDPLRRGWEESRRPRLGDPAPTATRRKSFTKTVTVAHRRLPKSVEVRAQGPGEIYDVSVIAVYRKNTGEETTHVLATHRGRRRGGYFRHAAVARFNHLFSRLPRAPDEVVVLYSVDADFRVDQDPVSVRVYADGREAGSALITKSDAESERNAMYMMDATESRPPFEGVQEDNEIGVLKFAIGEVVQSGAGADFDISTTLYPEGTRHFTEFSFLAVSPTIGVKLSDVVSIGASLQINYAEIAFDKPITEDADLMQGPAFPSGSLDAALGGNFGIPEAFGPAMKKVFNTSNTHAPGTSMTHTAKPNDPQFGMVTGTSEITNADSVGFSGRIGLLLTPTSKVRIGLTYQTRTAQQDFVGKAKIDYDRQIEAMVNSNAVAHSDEVNSLLGLGQPTEMRFTFDQVWNQGVVDVYVNDSLFISDFPLPNGSIVSNLPNQGANGFKADYDMIIRDFQMPPEIGIGTAIDVTDWFTLMLDYKRIFWSETFDEFNVELRNGTNADVNALIGSPHMEISIPLDWRDQNVIAIGFEFQALDWLRVRCGWNYGDNPIPEETALPIVPAITEHHASVGFTASVDSFRFDFAWLHAFKNSIDIDRSVQSPDLDGSTISVEQDFFVIGITHRY